MATTKKITTNSKSLNETEKKLEVARKRNKARRATIKINQEKKSNSRKVSPKSKSEKQTKTTKRKTKTPIEKRNSTNNKTFPTNTTRKSSSTSKKRVSTSTTSRGPKTKKTKKVRKTKPLLIHIMDMPRWARFIIYVIILAVVLYGYYLHSKEELLSTSVNFLNRNIFIIAPLAFVLLYSLTLFYLGYKAGKKG